MSAFVVHWKLFSFSVTTVKTKSSIALYLIQKFQVSSF